MKILRALTAALFLITSTPLTQSALAQMPPPECAPGGGTFLSLECELGTEIYGTPPFAIVLPAIHCYWVPRILPDCPAQ